MGHIGLKLAIVALWATCFFMSWLMLFSDSWKFSHSNQEARKHGLLHYPFVLRLPVNYHCNFIIEPGHEKMCLMSYANNKGADQPAHPRSLISAFIVCCLDSIISLDSIAEISRL